MAMKIYPVMKANFICLSGIANNAIKNKINMGINKKLTTHKSNLKPHKNIWNISKKSKLSLVKTKF